MWPFKKKSEKDILREKIIQSWKEHPEEWVFTLKDSGEYKLFMGTASRNGMLVHYRASGGMWSFQCDGVEWRSLYGDKDMSDEFHSALSHNLMMMDNHKAAALIKKMEE